MKKLLLPALLISSIAMTSCHGGDENYEAKNAIITDSIGVALPTCSSMKIMVEDNNTSMKIVVGDPTFYKATQEQKNKKAMELAAMVLRIYGKGNYLEKGMLVVTTNVSHVLPAEPADGISIPISFEEMKKAQGGK